MNSTTPKASFVVEVTRRIREAIASTLREDTHWDDTPILADYERLTLEYINNLNKLLNDNGKNQTNTASQASA